MQAETDRTTNVKVHALLDKNRTTKQIAATLGISVTAVRYHRNPHRQQLVNKATTERRRALKQKAVDYSGGQCLRCAYKLCLAALIFHHLDPEKKDLSLSSGKLWKWEAVLIELEKTMLLCCRCHTELHSGLWVPSKWMINRQRKIRQGWTGGAGGN